MQMTINVAEAIKTPGTVFSASFEEAFPEMAYHGSVYRYLAPVVLETDYVYTGDRLVVSGSFNTSLRAECARCLAEVCYPVRLTFSEEFSKNDPEAYAYTGEQIVLNKMVEDLICLNLPAKILCKENCKGLCPRCGADLNQETCACEKQEYPDNPFAALQKMLDENKEV
jgi:uncharacterized protein